MKSQTLKARLTERFFLLPHLGPDQEAEICLDWLKHVGDTECAQVVAARISYVRTFKEKKNERVR